MNYCNITDTTWNPRPLPSAYGDIAENYAAMPASRHLADGWRTAIAAVPPEGERIVESGVQFTATDALQVIVSTANIAEEAAAAEAARQAAKSDALKAVENRFLSLCETLTGSKTKASFSTLNAVIEGLVAAPETADAGRDVALRLLGIDAEGKREGGLQWWDDCTWHSDIE